jgi:flavorubredoxin
MQKKALVIYHSQEHGNTEAMAQAVAEGLKEAGLQVVTLNTNQDRLDLSTYPSYACVAIGTPDYFSYLAGGIKMFLDDHYIEEQRGTQGMFNKPIALFYSHGGGGKVKQPLVSLFKRLGPVVGDPVESYLKPDARVLEKCRKLGRGLAAATK